MVMEIRVIDLWWLELSTIPHRKIVVWTNETTDGSLPVFMWRRPVPSLKANAVKQIGCVRLAKELT